MAHIRCGLANCQIAKRLVISERTADAHVEHIRNELGRHARARATAWAGEHGPVTAATGQP